MIRYTLIIFLIIHILGDFYFQTEKVANRKRTDFKWTIYHIIVYGVITVLLFFFDIFHLSETEILRWTVKFLIIHKSTNIFIVNVLDLYKPLEKRQKIVNDKNAGRFIGTLERIIMTIFISINQYSAVGLVLTAKSIARYEKISHEQDFAEYYLAGTLLSTISAVCVSILF